MELQFSNFSHIFSYLTPFCEKDTLPILMSLRPSREGATLLQGLKIWHKSPAYIPSKSASKMEKNANSALHTAKSAIVDRILQEMYTPRFDESSCVEGRYNSVQCVKVWQKSPAYVSSKSASKMEKTRIQHVTLRKVSYLTAFYEKCTLPVLICLRVSRERTALYNVWKFH